MFIKKQCVERGLQLTIKSGQLLRDRLLIAQTIIIKLGNFRRTKPRPTSSFTYVLCSMHIHQETDNRNQKNAFYQTLFSIWLLGYSKHLRIECNLFENVSLFVENWRFAEAIDGVLTSCEVCRCHHSPTFPLEQQLVSENVEIFDFEILSCSLVLNIFLWI